MTHRYSWIGDPSVGLTERMKRTSQELKASLQQFLVRTGYKCLGAVCASYISTGLVHRSDLCMSQAATQSPQATPSFSLQ